MGIDLEHNYGSAFANTINNPLLLAMFIVVILIILVISIINIISYWKIFKKAGKHGWAALVPIYNLIVMLQIADMKIINLLLYFIPILNFYIIFKMNIRIAKHFNKSTGFGVGMTLLSVIFIPVLAFDDNEYSKNLNKDNSLVQEDLYNQINPTNVDTSVPSSPVLNIETSNNDNSQNNENEIDNIDNKANNINIEPINEITNQGIEENSKIIETNSNIEDNSLDNTPINIVEEPINTFNSMPIDNISNINQIDESSNIIEEEPNNNILGSKKYCKVCNEELPGIVSICPNCGADNDE